MHRLVTPGFAMLLCVGVFLTGCRRPPQDRTLDVYAAASLTDVMEALADTFRVMPGGVRVTVNVAGSSLLARQIERGAAADLFVSAHPDWTGYLYTKRRISPPVELPVANRLVKVRRQNGRPSENERIALADPEHVPAGMYAREALLCEGRWAMLAPRLVPTLDVRAAVAAVEAGAAGSAIVYASDTAMAPKLQVEDVVSERCRPQIRYTAAVVQGSALQEDAMRFLALMQDPGTAKLWERFGFGYDSTRSASDNSLESSSRRSTPLPSSNFPHMPIASIRPSAK